jgi:hypothetical protein
MLGVVGLPEGFTKALPDLFDSLFGSVPPIVMYMPAAALPASLGVAESLKPSEASSSTFELLPSTDTLSLISWPPLFETMPARKTACGCFEAMPW